MSAGTSRCRPDGAAASSSGSMTVRIAPCAAALDAVGARAGPRADDAHELLVLEQQADAVVGGVAVGDDAARDRVEEDRQPRRVAVAVDGHAARQEAEPGRRRGAARRARDAVLKPAHRAGADARRARRRSPTPRA